MNPLAALKDMRTIAALLGEAERTARRMGDEQPGAEHLLLAAMGMGDGAARRAMGRLGLDRDAVERAIVQEQAAGLVAAGIDAEAALRLAEPAPVRPDGGSGPYRSTVSAQELFQAAGAFARGERQRLSSAHVVLAAADHVAGTMGRVLDRLGVERDAMRASAREELR